MNNINSGTRAELASLLNITTKTLYNRYRKCLIYADNTKKIDIPASLERIIDFRIHETQPIQISNSIQRRELAKMIISELENRKTNFNLIRENNDKIIRADMLELISSEYSRLQELLSNMLYRKSPAQIKSTLSIAFHDSIKIIKKKSKN